MFSDNQDSFENKELHRAQCGKIILWYFLPQYTSVKKNVIILSAVKEFATRKAMLFQGMDAIALLQCTRPSVFKTHI